VKSDSSLIFNRLKTLNSVHRILMTGTPLNNNLRELFNLLNFLDPANFRSAAVGIASYQADFSAAI
jgi:SNF2 family DNA or RNA helicase